MSKLQEWIEMSNNIVFFGGAGVSTESGIPDFRSDNGLYKKKYRYPAEQMIFFFFLPNKAHLALAKLEKEGKLKAIVTQNIDGLHQKAGNQHVYELHGSVLSNTCTHCHAHYDLEETITSRNEQGIPICPKCSHIIKPNVVLYEEGLDQDVLYGAIDAIEKADMLIVAGTSLVVYPAAGLLQYYRGNKLVLINKEKTSMDHMAHLVIQDTVGKVLEEATINL